MPSADPPPSTKQTPASSSRSKLRRGIVLFALWWITNNIFAVDTDILFRRHGGIVRAVDIAICQNLVGLLICAIAALFTPRADSLLRLRRVAESARSCDGLSLLTVGTLHFAAAWLTASSYAAIGASSTLMWKLLEPLPAIFLKRVLLGLSTPLPATMGVIAVLGGVLTFTGPQFTAIQYAPIISSNVLFPLRNSLVKLMQIKSTGVAVGYAEMLIFGLPVSLVMLAARMFYMPTNMSDMLVLIMRNALLFNVYQFSSISLLMLVDPLSHSLLNTFKRFSGIVLAMIVLNRTVEMHHITGLIIALAGFIFYAFNSKIIRFLRAVIKPSKRSEPRKSRSMVRNVVVSTGVIFALTGVVVDVFGGLRGPVPFHSTAMNTTEDVGLVIPAAPAFVKTVTDTLPVTLSPRLTNAQHVGKPLVVEDDSNIDVNVTLSQDETSAVAAVVVQKHRIVPIAYSRRDIASEAADAVRRVVSPKNGFGGPLILPPSSIAVHNDMHVRRNTYMPFNFSIASYDDRELIVGNLGDMVWKYAAEHAVPDYSRVKQYVCHSESSPESCLKQSQYVLKEGQGIVYHYPTANMIAEDTQDAVTKIANMAAHPIVRKVLINGIGLQMNFPEGVTALELYDSSWWKAGVGYETSNELRNAMEVLNSKRASVLARGDMTAEVMRRAGLRHVISVGCPSLMISRDINLGATLAAKYEALRSRIGDRTLRVGINLKPFSKSFPLFEKILAEYPNSICYVQHWHDLNLCQRLGVEFNRTRTFDNVADWIASMADRDVMFGGRIHGTMTAIAAGVPAAVIATDYRVLELTKRMHVPHIPAVDSRLAVNRGVFFDVAELMTKIGFDGAMFDLNRCRSAKIYEREYGAVGMDVQPHVRQMATQC